MEAKLLAIVGALMLAATGAYMAFHPQDVEEFTSAFENFKAKHGKFYETEAEEAYRFAVYVENIKMINNHNSGDHSYTMAENHMADLTQEEFEGLYLGWSGESDVYNHSDESYITNDIDWRKEGAVQKVKNQGQCGSCWAFSAVAAVESFSYVSTGKLGDFAEQQLVDCSRSYGNNGCNGGLMDYAFRYFHDHGICEESSYRYTARDGSCKASSCTMSSFKVGGYKDVHGVDGLKEACNKQPVSIAVDARKWSFYSGGIYSDCGTGLDHGVLLAGYNSEYWIVKNSWGTSWGEEGYIRLKMGNTCGLANQPSYPN